MKEEMLIKTTTAFGSASHIIMKKEDLNKNFLVLPESAKFILDEILQNYQIALKNILNPLLVEVFDDYQLKIIKKTYEDKMRKIDNMMHRKFLQSDCENLKIYHVDNLLMILNDIGDNLPKELKKKMAKEYYKYCQTKNNSSSNS